MKKDNLQNIKNVLKDYKADYGLNTKLNDARIKEQWSNLVGVSIAKVTTKMYIKDSVLYVYISSSVVRHELSMIKTPLMEKLNEISESEISDIRFL